MTALAGESERTRGTVGAGKKVNKNGTKMKEADAQTQDLGRKGVGEYRFRRHTLRKANKVED